MNVNTNQSNHFNSRFAVGAYGANVSSFTRLRRRMMASQEQDKEEQEEEAESKDVMENESEPFYLNPDVWALS